MTSHISVFAYAGYGFSVLLAYTIQLGNWNIVGIWTARPVRAV